MLKKKLFFWMYFILLFTANAFADSAKINYNQVSDQASINEKIYIASDQVVLSKNGIFIFLQDFDGNIIKEYISQLNFDENGLFVLRSEFSNPQVLERCPNFHLNLCPRCFGCREPTCRFRCVCVR